MHQQGIIFESSPGWIIVCLLVGIGYAFLLYKAKHPWGVAVNRMLFALRALLAFLLAFLLLGPIVKQINNLLEKPLFVLLVDDSGSIKEGVDSLALAKIENEVISLRESLEEKGYDVKINNLEGEEVENSFQFQGPVTDLQNALRSIANRYEGRRTDGVLLVSDGIFNAGVSPLYASYNFPVSTLGIGDTTQRVDVSIRNVAYNKIAYQGNQFPIRVEVLSKGIANRSLAVSLVQGGKVIDRQAKSSSEDGLTVYDFKVLANEKGIQKYDIVVESLPEEMNKRNNRSSVFVDVVEGKKKILLVASSPHPDIKAIRSVIDKNSNYEFLLHIPGVDELPAQTLNNEKIDLYILHQVPDQRGKTRDLFLRIVKSETPMFIIVGKYSDLSLLAAQGAPLRVEGVPREYDDVTPVINPAYNNFIVSTETRSVIADYPPLSVPFGKIQIPLGSTALLYQQVGNITTDKPLLTIDSRDDRKIGLLLGEGIWRWRLDEYGKAEETTGFDELFSKLLQYLSTSEEKKKFSSYPIQQEFSEVEQVVFESQVYNDIFEPVFGNTIDIELSDEAGKKSRYTYVTSPGNIRYQIGGLKEGVYRYSSSTLLDDKTERVNGQFVVVSRQTELNNLTADFDLLRKLSSNTGGRFYTMDKLNNLTNDLLVKEATGIIRAEEKYDSLIQLKWIFFVLLAMISTEWFVRKYYGSY